jgi:hypothetical protein
MTPLMILAEPFSSQAVTNIPGARYLSSAVFYSGKIWLIGGVGWIADGSSEWSNDILRESALGFHSPGFSWPSQRRVDL